jgi:hypothetical protein
MTVLALYNATLSLVKGVGSSGDYDRDPVLGSTKFTGSERVFWSESEERVTVGTDSDIVVRRTMLVDPELGVTWQQGDTVTIVRDGSASNETARVRRFMVSGTDETDRVARVIMEDA